MLTLNPWVVSLFIAPSSGRSHFVIALRRNSTRARLTGRLGVSAGVEKSLIQVIHDDGVSTITLSSWKRVGTAPVGFSLRYPGWR